MIHVAFGNSISVRKFCAVNLHSSRCLAIVAALSAVLSSLLGDPGAVRAKEITLVKDRQPMCVILIGRDSGAVAECAARELQHYLKKVGGADVPIMAEEETDLSDLHWLSNEYVVVSLGDTAFAQRLGIASPEAGTEGFRIKTISGHRRQKALVITGDDSVVNSTKLRSTGWQTLLRSSQRRGTLFGVYTFLEDYLGVRWLWPGELGEVTPARPDVSIPELDRTEKPAFAIRTFRTGLSSSAIRDHSREIGESPASMLRRVANTNDWTQRMRLGASVVIEQTHSYGQSFWQQHHQTHPEWFALLPNGRRDHLSAADDRVRLCYSNAELQEEIAIKVERSIEAAPDALSYSIGMDDASWGDVFCQCDNCKNFGPTLSDRVFRFSSEVAKRVADRRPDKYVTQLAYSQWVDPPQIAKLNDHVIVSFVGVNTSGYLYAPDRAASRQKWEQWTRVADSKLLWRPNLPVSLGIPIVINRKMAEDLRSFAPDSWGADIDFLEPSWASRGLDWYVASKLLWNLDLDVDELIEDYCTSGFGPAARPVREYFRLLEQYTDEMATLAPDEGYPDFAKFVPSYLSADRVAVLEGLLDDASRLTEDDSLARRRIEFLAESLQWTKTALRAWEQLAQPGKSEDARIAIEEMYSFLHQHRESYAIHSGYLHSKIDWIVKDSVSQREDLQDAVQGKK